MESVASAAPLLGLDRTQVLSALPVIPLVPETVFITSLSACLRVWCTAIRHAAWSSASFFSAPKSR